MQIHSDGAYLVEREKKISCGPNVLDVDIFPAYHQSGGRGRKPRQKESCPAQRNLNDKNARKYLVRLILTNFVEGDYKLELTYNPQFCPATPEELARNGKNFIRRLRSLCKKLGLPDPRYILVNAWGISQKTGQMVRPHHHLIISGGLTVEQILPLWRGRGRTGKAYGYVDYSPLQFDADTGIAGLANYLADQPTHGHRWCGSHNLVRPTSTTNDSRYSRRRLTRLIGAEPYKAYGAACRGLINYDAWCAKYPGWRLVEYAPEFNEVVGAWYISLRFVRDDRPPNGGRQRR